MEKKKKISLQDIGTPKLLLLTVSGIALVLLSMPSSCTGTKKQGETEIIYETQEDKSSYCVTLEEKLEDMITSLKGIDSAKVMITLRSSTEKVVLKDYPYESAESEESGDGVTRKDKEYVYSDTTVLVTDEDGNTRPYVIKELEPEIAGVAVVYKGSGGAEITYQVTGMVQALFQIDAHKISVIEQ